MKSDDALKARTFTAIEKLHGMHLTDVEIGSFVGISPQRVGRIVMLLRLEPPKFATFAELATWLANERPELETECRLLREFRNETTSQAENDKAA